MTSLFNKKRIRLKQEKIKNDLEQAQRMGMEKDCIKKDDLPVELNIRATRRRRAKDMENFKKKKGDVESFLAKY